jgi:ketosteroid isomerase-like protein
VSDRKADDARAVMKALSNRRLGDLLAPCHEDVEWYSFFAALNEGGAYRGHAGLRQYLADLDDAFEFVRAEVADEVVVGDVVVMVGQIHYRGKESGLDDTMPAGWMIKFRGEKVLVFRAFREPEAALEAVGIN